jgi:hypothetical protein
MINALLNVLFGCSHRRTTFPFTPVRKVGNSNGRNGTYVVCLDCGKEFDYNWQEMRIGDPVAARVAVQQTLSPSARVPASAQETLSPAHR